MKKSNGVPKHNKHSYKMKRKNTLIRMRARQCRSYDAQLNLCSTRMGECKKEVTRLIRAMTEQ